MNEKIRMLILEHFVGVGPGEEMPSAEELTEDQILRALEGVAKHGHRPFGVGDKADSETLREQRFGTGERLEVILGQHPHSYSDNSFYARAQDGEIYDFDGHHVRHKIEIWEENYLKVSGLSGNEVRKTCGLKIWIDDCLAFNGSGGRTWEHAMRYAQKFLGRLQEPHPWTGYWKPSVQQELLGRKVFWCGVPAVVRYVFADQACVVLECVDGLFPLSPYEQEDIAKRARMEREGDEWAWTVQEPPSADDRRSVKAEVWDPKIWWYREEVRGKDEVEA